MQTSMTTQTTVHAPNAGLQLSNSGGNESWEHCVDPMAVAQLDFGLFKSLYKLGVSRERICSAMFISYEDFDYLCKFSMKRQGGESCG